MSRKQRKEVHLDVGRWMISYADFITLMFAFFVVLFSSAPKEDTNTRLITAASQQSFTSFAIFRGGGSKLAGQRMKQSGDGVELQPEDELPLTTQPRGVDAVIDRQKNLSADSEDYKPNSRVRDSLMQDFYKEVLDKNGNLDVSMESRGLVVSFNDIAFYEVGSDKPRPDSLKQLKMIMEIVVERNNLIQVEGHSDGTSADKGRYSSNMEMSSRRAEEIANILINNFNIPQEYVSAVGYGGFRPKGDPNTQRGRAKNRRVDLVLLKSVPDERRLVMPNFEKKEEKIAVERLLE